MEGGNSYEASLFPHLGDAPDPVIARAGDPARIEAVYGGAPAADVARMLTTDVLITEPDRYLARHMARQGLRVWVYHFSYVPAAMRPTSYGAAHGSEVTYVFDNLSDVPQRRSVTTTIRILATLSKIRTRWRQPTPRCTPACATW